MAERRMFAKTIIDSDAFLDMPMSAQCLYFHLAMRADDDGFLNNPKKVQRMVGASDDDMRILLAKRFLIVFESGVVVIKHWKIHNYIQKDRYKPTVYQEEKSLLTEKENGVYTECIQDGYTLEPQVSIGKSKSKSKDRDRLESGKGSVDNTPLPPQGEEAPNLEEMFGYNQFLLEAVNDWLAYKKEKNQKYKPVGLKTLLTTIQNNVSKYGEDAVTELIRDSMSANYQGITWDRLKNQRSQNGGKKAPSFYDMWKEEKQNDERTDAETAFPF